LNIETSTVSLKFNVKQNLFRVLLFVLISKWWKNRRSDNFHALNICFQIVLEFSNFNFEYFVLVLYIFYALTLKCSGFWKILATLLPIKQMKSISAPFASELLFIAKPDSTITKHNINIIFYLVKKNYFWCLMYNLI
jgi:hypothetical protein